MNVFRRSLLFIFLALVASQLHAQTTSRFLVGNWSGTYEGDTIEIALWFDRKPTELPHVRGFIINQTQNCGAGLAGERSMSIVTTFFRWVSDPELTDYSIEFESRRLEPAPIELCAAMKSHARLMLDYNTSNDRVRILGLDDPPMTDGYTNLKELMLVTRQPASELMQALVASNPSISNEQGPGAPPGSGVAMLLANSMLDPESTVTSEELPCTVRQRDQQVRMQRMGIHSLAGSLESAQQLGVRYVQFAGPIPNFGWSDEFTESKEDRYIKLPVEKIAQSDFLEMPPGRQQRFGPDACKQAAAVDQFLSVLQAGEVGNSLLAAESGAESPRIDDAEGLYFFDRDGIDRIRGLEMVRVYGTTTIFVPGELSREGTWTPATQSMKMRAMVKTTQLDLVEKDLLSFYNEAKFAYDPELSKRTGSDMWVTVSDSREGGVCIRWRNKHFFDNCVEHSTAEMYRQHRYYMTKDLTVAKRIFAEISPDATTLTAAELANPVRECAKGPFCSLPGGLYLNAIYNGDFALIQELDEALAINARASQKRVFPSMAEKIFDLEGAMFEIIAIPKSFTANLAHRYMYQYQKTPISCLDPGHQVVPKEEFVPATYFPQPDIDDVPQPDIKNSDAYWLRSSYTINPPFIGLCDRLCDATTPDHTSGFVTDEYRTITLSLDRVLFDNDCKSAEIKQFERNLISMTTKSLGSRPRAAFTQRSSL